MAPILPTRSLQLHTASIREASHAPAYHLRQQRQKPLESSDLKRRVLPFYFSMFVKPSLTFPKDLRAFHYPPDQIVVTKNHIYPPQNQMIKYSSNAVFFTDPMLRGYIAEFFSYTIRDRNSNDNGNNWQPCSGEINFHTTASQAPSYNVNDDDVLVWRKRLEGGEDDWAGDAEVERVGWSVSGAWPPWKFRFDLEL